MTRLTLILSVLLTVPALGQTTRPATRPATQPSPLYVTHPDKARVLVCTYPYPDRSLRSEIPPDVLRDYPVADVVITTHLPPERWEEAFERARRLGGYLMLDEELKPTGLDWYKGDRKQWQENMDFCAKALNYVHERAPDLKVFFYPKTPPRHGVPRSWLTRATDKPYFIQRDFLDVMKAEKKAFKVSGRLLEAYTYDATGKDETTFVQWAEDLDYMAMQAEAQGIEGETWCLLSPWKWDEQRNEWVQASDALWERQLRHVMAEGYRPVLWNPQEAGWTVIKRVLGH